MKSYRVTITRTIYASVMVGAHNADDAAALAQELLTDRPNDTRVEILDVDDDYTTRRI